MTREKRRVPESEAALVEAFCALIEQRNERIQKCRGADDHPHGKKKLWTIYREACDWDLMLAEEGSGVQIGIEAKLCLNIKVLNQALSGSSNERWQTSGPDYRAVLVPRGGRNGAELGLICDRLGLTVLGIYDMRPYSAEPEWHLSDQLPDQDDPTDFCMDGWHWWAPLERCKLPDYVPDVPAGVASPLKLTEWKIRAIKLWILLDRRGHVTRADMKALGLSQSRFCDRFHGMLKPDPSAGGYVRHDASPDFRAQHPRNYAEIEADFEKWTPPGYRIEAELAASEQGNAS
jgi:hypothetical protein